MEKPMVGWVAAKLKTDLQELQVVLSMAN